MSTNTVKKNVTKREMFSAIIAKFEDSGEGLTLDDGRVITNAEVIGKLENEVSLLDSKKSKTSTKKNETHETVKAAIVEVLLDLPEGAAGMQAGAIFKDSRVLAALPANTYSPNVVIAMLTKLRAEGKVIRVKDKKVSLFHLAAPGEVEVDED
jgi:hypothetical protein